MGNSLLNPRPTHSPLPTQNYPFLLHFKQTGINLKIKSLLITYPLYPKGPVTTTCNVNQMQVSNTHTHLDKSFKTVFLDLGSEECGAVINIMYKNTLTLNASDESKACGRINKVTSILGVISKEVQVSHQDQPQHTHRAASETLLRTKTHEINTDVQNFSFSLSQQPGIEVSSEMLTTKHKG